MSWRDRLPPVRGRIALDAPLGPYTWLRVGGPAEVLFIPADEADLQDFLLALDPSVPVTALGVGSNLLVRDGGVDGVVVRLGKAFADLRLMDQNRIYAGAAALDAQASRFRRRGRPVGAGVLHRRAGGDRRGPGDERRLLWR